MNIIPLNQSYKQKITFEQYPKIKTIKDEYEKFCLNTNWGKYGRSYDCSIAMHQVDFNNKTVCELGARDSLFSSYLTRFVNKIYVSDIFEEWGNLGDLKKWESFWKINSFSPDNLVAERQDMRKLSYQDNSMDVVVSFSAIEHIKNNGDIQSIREMARICKSGGKIVISTDLCMKHLWYSGGYFYDEASLFDRIINSSGGSLYGNYDFSFEKSDRHILNNAIDYTSVFFILNKK
jgi:2-polyprenyl-3-methyl-5-hydroxy-6-metoxy-1,4-benzoquinol methylase